MNNKIIIKLGKSANIVIDDFELIEGPLIKGEQTVFAFAISNLVRPERYNNCWVIAYYQWLECTVYYNGKKYNNGEITGLKYDRDNKKIYLETCFYS